MMNADDRAIFMAADDYPCTLADGLIVNVHEDPDGYLAAGDDEPPDTQYCGVTVDAPTGEHVGLWSIDIPPHLSGHAARELIWSVIGPDCYDLIGEVRAARDTEQREAAHWAARDVETVRRISR